MPTMRAQVVIPFYSGLPTDVMTNTFHFYTISQEKDQAAVDLVDRLELFYNTIFTISGSAANYVNWDEALLKVYDLSEAPPRSPGEQPLNLAPTSPGATVVPTEVSMVISSRTAYVSGTPRARLRNRVYIGGLGNAALDASTTTSFPLFDNDFRNYAATAAGTMRADSSDDLAWAIYSPTVGGHMGEVQQGWIDNSPDTQRRRGVETSTRTIWG